MWRKWTSKEGHSLALLVKIDLYFLFLQEGRGCGGGFVSLLTARTEAEWFVCCDRFSSITLPFLSFRTVACSIYVFCFDYFDCVFQLFYSFFKSMIGKDLKIELKNDLIITGTLLSVDQYLNFKLKDIHVDDEENFPHMVPFLFFLFSFLSALK